MVDRDGLQAKYVDWLMRELDDAAKHELVKYFINERLNVLDDEDLEDEVMEMAPSVFDNELMAEVYGNMATK